MKEWIAMAGLFFVAKYGELIILKEQNDKLEEKKIAIDGDEMCIEWKAEELYDDKG